MDNENENEKYDLFGKYTNDAIKEIVEVQEAREKIKNKHKSKTLALLSNPNVAKLLTNPESLKKLAFFLVAMFLTGIFSTLYFIISSLIKLFTLIFLIF